MDSVPISFLLQKKRGNLRLQLREASTANYIKSGVVANQKTLIYNLDNKKNVVTIIFTIN